MACSVDSAPRASSSRCTRTSPSTPTRRATTSSKRSRGTSAAAPATRASCAPSSGPPPPYETASPDSSKEAPQVIDEQSGLLHGGEVPAAWHVGPMRHVVPAFDPGAWDPERLLRIAGDAGGHADEPGTVLRRVDVRAFPVEARRRGDGLCHPVRHHVRDQLVAGEDVLGVAVAVAPGTELLDDPGEQPGR